MPGLRDDKNFGGCFLWLGLLRPWRLFRKQQSTLSTPRPRHLPARDVLLEPVFERDDENGDSSSDEGDDDGSWVPTSTSTDAAAAAAAAAAAVAADGSVMCLSCFDRFRPEELPRALKAAGPGSTSISSTSDTGSTSSSSSSTRGSSGSSGSTTGACGGRTVPKEWQQQQQQAASAGCGHYFCSSCLTEYVRGAVRERRFPVRCPMAAAAAAGAAGGGGAGRAAPGGVGVGVGPQQHQQQQHPQGGCRLRFTRERVMAALEGHPRELQLFEQLEVEHVIRRLPRVFCPHPGCSTPLLLPGPPAAAPAAAAAAAAPGPAAGVDQLPADKPVTCPACRAAFCPRCLIPGWHKGFSCAAFQALPPQERNPDTAAVLRLSAQRSWQRCPVCRALVERSGGCNHIRCRCGTQFCYACGCRYLSSKPSANNVHGTQGCTCALWYG
ncbi:hypothetical protein PLESTM_001354300 [Pleodorina starrii]|nr:hypothetical protein PLESTM_001354300 [Pleodorina starrii]